MNAQRGLPRVVAIGGGKIERLQTLEIDREIVRLTGRRRPRVLFVGTASEDSPDYWKRFNRCYRDTLGCETEVLQLISERPSSAEIREKIEAADAIYVGGGNTLRMMNLWRRLGVDRLLRKAHRRGTVLCGLSAGAICWFASGTSDSRRFSSPQQWSYIRVTGMGLYPLIMSPHHIKEKGRKPYLIKLMKHARQPAIAVDDWAALEIVGERYRVLSCRPRAGCCLVYWNDAVVRYEALAVSRQYRSLNQLTAPPA